MPQRLASAQQAAACQPRLTRHQAAMDFRIWTPHSNTNPRPYKCIVAGFQIDRTSFIMPFNFFRASQSPKTVASPASPFLALPADAILCIADFLPVESVAYLALCNRMLSQLLGPRSWVPLCGCDSEQKVAFLSTLARDLPQYFVCHICFRLHKTDSVQWPRFVPYNHNLSGVHHAADPLRYVVCESCLQRHSTCSVQDSQTSSCVHHQPDFCIYQFSFYRVQFVHVQLAMMHYHLGPKYGIPLEAFSHTEVMLNVSRGFTTLISVEARVASDKLLMRSQQWFLVPTEQRDELFTGGVVDHLCGHLPSQSSFVQRLVRRRLDHPNCSDSFCSPTLQCQICHMDFTVDAFDFGAKGTAIAVTRYINLGSGLAPKDLNWQCQLIPKPYHYAQPLQPSPKGSIRAAFESQSGQPYAALTADNSVKLFSTRKRKPKTIGADGLVWRWHSPGSLWWYLEQPEKKLVLLSFIAAMNSSGKYLLKAFRRFLSKGRTFVCRRGKCMCGKSMLKDHSCSRKI
jgi:hypothetical protein